MDFVEALDKEIVATLMTDHGHPGYYYFDDASMCVTLLSNKSKLNNKSLKSLDNSKFFQVRNAAKALRKLTAREREIFAGFMFREHNLQPSEAEVDVLISKVKADDVLKECVVRNSNSHFKMVKIN